MIEGQSVFFPNKNTLEILVCGSFFIQQQYLASYLKMNITNVSKDVKLCYSSTALTDPLWYLSLLQNFWSHWFVRRKTQRSELKIHVVVESSIHSCYEAIVAESYFPVNISCHHNLSGSEVSKTLSWSKMPWLSEELL